MKHATLPALAPMPVTAPARPVARSEADPRLDWLRRIAGRCRCTARADLFRACAVLSADRAAAAEAYAEALFRAMPMGRLSLYRPGCSERSFDEAWLIALLDAAGRDDHASLAFLMARRIPPHARRHVGFLVASVARQLDTLT